MPNLMNGQLGRTSFLFNGVVCNCSIYKRSQTAKAFEMRNLPCKTLIKNRGMQPSKITAFKSNPTFQVFVFEYLRHYSGKALFFDPPLWSKVIIGNTTFLSYPLHFVSVPTKPALVFHNKLWEEEREKVLKVFSWNAHSIKKKN